VKSRYGHASATSTSITDSAASFPTDESLIGLPVYIRNGTGIGQARHISANDSTSITVSESWTTTPDTTSEYVIGLIRQELVGRDETAGSPHDEKRFQTLELSLH
jgi:hypothetical protein